MRHLTGAMYSMTYFAKGDASSKVSTSACKSLFKSVGIIVHVSKRRKAHVYVGTLIPVGNWNYCSTNNMLIEQGLGRSVTWALRQRSMASLLLDNSTKIAKVLQMNFHSSAIRTPDENQVLAVLPTGATERREEKVTIEFTC